MKKIIITLLIFSFTILPLFADYNNSNDNNDGKNIEAGNRIEHEQYGKGTIYQVVDYKGKTVYAVIFDNYGKKFVKKNTVKKIDN